jgi:hypothetical protein
MPSADPHQFPTARPSGRFGSDEVPSGHAAVFAFLELVAGSFIFGGGDALFNGASWRVYVPAFACGTLFFLVGIKSPWIKGKFTSVDWVLWGKRMDRALRVVLALVLVSLVASGYFLYREASAFWRDALRHVPSASEDQASKSSGAPAVPKLQDPPTVSKSPQSPIVPSTKHVDWRDKHNWRGNLRVGMTETEVYRLFGEPERVQVSGNLELWHYGYGEITFSDGTLYSWDEPEY